MSRTLTDGMARLPRTPDKIAEHNHGDSDRLTAVASRRFHRGGVQILLADGSSRFIRQTIDDQPALALGVGQGELFNVGGL